MRANTNRALPNGNALFVVEVTGLEPSSLPSHIRAHCDRAQCAAAGARSLLFPAASPAPCLAPCLERHGSIRTWLCRRFTKISAPAPAIFREKNDFLLKIKTSLRFSGALRFGRGRGFKTVRANTNRRTVNTVRLFVVEVTGLEPSSLPSLLSRIALPRNAPMWRSVAPLPKNLATLRFSGTLCLERGRGFKTLHTDTNRALPNGNALFVVEVTGLEPTTSWSLTKRATKLRYTSKDSILYYT